MKFMISNYKNANPATSPERGTKIISFCGLNAGKIKHLTAIQSMANSKLDGLFNELESNVAADFIIKNGDGNFYKKAHSFIETAKYPIFDLPKDLLAFVAKKFNIQSLENSKLLTNYRQQNAKKAYERAMRGILQNGDNFIEAIAAKKGYTPKQIEEIINNGQLNDGFWKINNELEDKFYKIFDENLAKTKAHYNTPHERTVARLASGITAATMMGNDFYNKAILNGKNQDEAVKSAKKKRKQELLETAQEALSQYFMLGAFASLVNNSPIAAPIINTALGLLFKITSRVSTGRPLKRIKIPPKTKYNTPSMNEYAKLKKEKQNIQVKAQYQKQEKKKHLLSPKNIAMACLASIGIGFSFNALKSSKGFKGLMSSINNIGLIKNMKSAYRKATVQEVYLGKDEIDKFLNVLSECELENQKTYLEFQLLQKGFKQGTVKDQKLLIGEYEKMTRIPFTKIEMSKKELLQIPLAPFKLIFEFASYPYKLAKSLAQTKNLIPKTSKPKLKNEYNILNTYLDFSERLKANNNVVDDAFIKKYAKHLKDNKISALNKETQSAVNNSTIGKTTQIMGTFASLYFAMADDYNETAKQTGDKQKAQKDARLRGVNKIIRMATQTTCMKMNEIFKIPYAKSVMGAGIITVACTILTDSISRTLSGMPFKKMNKDELEQYNKHKKESVLKGYYDTLDKLTD